jgi:hypothetical protein
MTENRYMLITVDDGSSPPTLDLYLFDDLGELEHAVPSRMVEALHAPFMDFSGQAKAGDVRSGKLLGCDYVLVCGRSKPDDLCLKLSHGLMQIMRVLEGGDPALVPAPNAPMHRSMVSQIVGRSLDRFSELRRAPTVKSPAEVEELKRQWLADGCWDIENTEGFEAHRAELIEWKLGLVIAELEARQAALREQVQVKRPRLFEFANGSEIDVDRYLALDATASNHVATFQLHHSYHRVYFDSDEQRTAELERMRAFRDGRVS